MIQDIAPHRYDVAYRTDRPQKDDILLVYWKNCLLCSVCGKRAVFPTVAEAAEVYCEVYREAVFLFRIDERNYFGLCAEGPDAFGEFDFISKDRLRAVRPLLDAFAGVTGMQICKWYLQNRFCGCCGGRMELHGRERALRCPACGRVSYPQICPSVIVGILDGDKILLTRYAKEHSSFRKYALVAGYVEVGESLEDTVRREVMEEVGLRVKNIRYYKSQPWPFTDALLAGFFCEVDGSRTVRLDKDELSEAKWFTRGKLPEGHSEASISLTGEMIEAFEKGLFTQLFDLDSVH